jgi:hypothetical protein
MHSTRVLSNSFLTSSGKHSCRNPHGPIAFLDAFSHIPRHTTRHRTFSLYKRCNKSPKTWKKSPIISPDPASEPTTKSRLKMVRESSDKASKRTLMQAQILPQSVKLAHCQCWTGNPSEKKGYVSTVSHRMSGRSGNSEEAKSPIIRPESRSEQAVYLQGRAHAGNADNPRPNQARTMLQSAKLAHYRCQTGILLETRGSCAAVLRGMSGLRGPQ